MNMSSSFMSLFLMIYGCIVFLVDATDIQAEAIIKELLSSQDESADAVIHLDDVTFHRFAIEPRHRSYGLIIFFDAMQLRDKKELRLQDLRHEFGLISSAYFKIAQQEILVSKVFFCELEYTTSHATFDALNVTAVPFIKHLPAGATGLRKAVSLGERELLHITDSMVKFVEHRLNRKIGLIKRATHMKYTLSSLLICVLMGSPFIATILMTKGAILKDPEVWCIGAMLVYFFSISGGMYHIIRNTPYYVVEEGGNVKWFYVERNGRVAGAGGFLIGFLYIAFGLILSFCSRLLIYERSKNVQRVVMLVGMGTCFWIVRKLLLLYNTNFQA
ncbi:hypothetical protein O6H91_02G096600 [Diphasiastrum complanatum]|uniref:Uncharacterized protein n=1 Tax=Diphasiastrum complanatum TaxID=34168 RepID=A0ACC2EI69_DIPCM|nr:hypothetical protein O6H91_02G096600 [Diphasiastrum complanatum]